MSTNDNIDDEQHTTESLREEIEQHDKESKIYKIEESYNSETYDYTLETERATSQKPKKSKQNNTDFVDPLENLTPQQRKIYEIRQKLNKSKETIYQSVLDEHKRVHSGPQDDINEKRKLYNEKIKQEDEEIKKSGKDPKLERLKNTTAEDLLKKQSKKKPSTNGNSKEVDSNQHVYKSYKKRVKNLESFKQSEHFTPVVSDDSKVIDELEYGIAAPNIPKANINAMKQELLKNIEARKSFKGKKRGVNPDEDINYVNEDNRIFNKKVARAYDKYTVETRQNLERGTAL
eukprot:gene5106-6356_t